MSKTIIIDDHPIIRMAVRVLLERAGHSVVGEAQDGVTGVQLAGTEIHDLVIVDLDLARLSGLEVIRRIRSAGGRGKILVYSAMDPDFYAVRCERAGADGFVSKDAELSLLEVGVTAVLGGYRYFPSAPVLAPGLTGEADELRLLDTLSDRELTVLRYLAMGYTNIQIANEFLINNKTVSSYKKRLQDKLSVDSVVGLSEFAKRNSIV